jgi:hemolysin activation/secretion protein
VHNLRTSASCILLSALLTAMAPACWAVTRQAVIDQMTRPTTPGQVAQSATPMGEVLSTFAPATSIGEAPNFDMTGLVVVHQTVAAQIGSKAFVPKQATFIVDPAVKWDKTIEDAVAQSLTGKTLTAVVLAEAAQLIQTYSEENGQACVIRVEPGAETAGNESIAIRLTPVLLKQLAIEEGKYFKARSVKHQLQAKANTAFNPRRLKGQIQQVMDNPDITVNAALEPINLENPHEQAVQIKLSIDDRIPYHVAGYWSNVDQFDYGEYIAGVGIVNNNLTGFGDTLAVFPVLDRYTSGVVMHYEAPINAYGTRFKVDNSIIGTQPKNADYAANRFRGRGWTLGVGLSHPLIRRTNWRLTADATAELQQVRTLATKSELGTLAVEQENLRNLRFGLQWDHTGDYGTAMLRNEVTQGLDVLGATPNTSIKLPVRGGGSQYTRLISTLMFEKNLPHEMAFVLNAQGQYSPNKLPSFQQYGAGGTFTGRGYKEAYLGGDSAVFVSGQLNMPAFFIPKSWQFPFTKTSVRDSVQLLAFTDYTWVKLNDRYTGADPTEHLLSTGVGARIKINKYVTARIDLGIPIVRNPPFRQSPRVHFGVIGAIF